LDFLQSCRILNIIIKWRGKKFEYSNIRIWSLHVCNSDSDMRIQWVWHWAQGRCGGPDRDPHRAPALTPGDAALAIGAARDVLGAVARIPGRPSPPDSAARRHRHPPPYSIYTSQVFTRRAPPPSWNLGFPQQSLCAKSNRGVRHPPPPPGGAPRERLSGQTAGDTAAAVAAGPPPPSRRRKALPLLSLISPVPEN